MLIEDWRHDYHRPHSALGMMTPAAFASRSPSAVSAARSNGIWGSGRAPRPAFSIPTGAPQPLSSQRCDGRVLLRRSPQPRHTPTAAAATVASASHPPSFICRWTDE